MGILKEKKVEVVKNINFNLNLQKRIESKAKVNGTEMKFLRNIERETKIDNECNV